MALSQKVVIRLTDDQRHSLHQFIRTGERSAVMLRRAQILLKADVGGPDDWSDAKIGQTFGCSFMTVRRVRQQFVAEGLDMTLHRKRPTGRQYRKLDGKQEAQLVAIACSPVPEGRSRWTMSLLSERLVEMKVVESIDPATVWRTLKKTRSNRGSNSSGLYRPRPMRRS